MTLKLVQSHHKRYKNEDLMEVTVTKKVERSSSPSVPSKCKILHFAMSPGWPDKHSKETLACFISAKTARKLALVSDQ